MGVTLLCVKPRWESLTFRRGALLDRWQRANAVRSARPGRESWPLPDGCRRPPHGPFFSCICRRTSGSYRLPLPLPCGFLPWPCDGFRLRFGLPLALPLALLICEGVGDGNTAMAKVAGKLSLLSPSARRLMVSCSSRSDSSMHQSLISTCSDQPPPSRQRGTQYRQTSSRT